jgi:PDZ and LIM domain protein 5/6/7
MMPKSGVFKRSEVFQALNDAQLKTKEEIENELRGWTTFLQKPNRPVPAKSNQTIMSTYKPVIVKQPKPKCAPDYRVTPSPSPVS